jgi:hypothetical protein
VEDNLACGGMNVTFRGVCRVDEGSVHPCLVAGIDIGHLLYTLMTMGWFVILMLPFMLLTLVIWLGIGLRALAGAWFS